MTSIAIIGAGPRGVGLLERLSANAPELLTGNLTVHLIDPYPPGPGRVWRREQSELLWMNSMASDVTMFLDSSVDCAGPIRPGPPLSQWAADARERQAAGLPEPVDDLPEDLAVQVRAVGERTFASRQVQSAYLSWFYQRVVEFLPDDLTVRLHAVHARGIGEREDGVQQVWLEEPEDPLLAHIVVLALGHMDSDPAREHQRLRQHALRHRASYLPPEYSADADLSGIRPREDVILRGFGLAFVDLMVLLTEGRGGQYRPDVDGSLTYVPSGAEPVIHVGSRRGVPYRAKLDYGRPRGRRPRFPEFFHPQAIEKLPQRSDFRRDVQPLIEKEIGWGHYQELFIGHPDRVTMPSPEFAGHYTTVAWDSDELRKLVDQAVPDLRDRLDLAALDRPMAGMSFQDSDSLQSWMREHIAADLARRSDPAHSADLGVFLALLSVYGQMPALLGSGKLSARSQVRDLDGWWFGFFNYLASGPPGPRLRQLQALSRAGVVRFLGADMWVEPEAGGFQAGSASIADTVHARVLVEAQLPASSVARSRNPLLRGLFQQGAGAEETLAEDGFHRSTGRLRVNERSQIVDSAGRPHPRRFALGSYTSGRSAAAFARPRTNSSAFRQNDAVARDILRTVGQSALRRAG